jgi:hypothetical protein
LECTGFQDLNGGRRVEFGQRAKLFLDGGMAQI